MTTIAVQTLLPQHRSSVADAIEHSHAENTASTYATGWRAWLRFCAAYNYVSLPASPETFAAFLVSLQDEGKSASSIATYYQAVLDAHRSAGIADSLHVEGVRRTLMGIRRAARGYETVKARALSIAELMALVRACDDSYLGIRDAAWWVVSTATGLRYSDFACLQRKHVTVVPGHGVLVKVPYSKTDQTGNGVLLPLPDLLPEFALLDAPKALNRLLNALPAGQDQYLLPGVYRGGYQWRTGGAVSNQGLNAGIRSLSERAGVNPTLLTSHSGRSTYATGAYASGASEESIAAAGRWSNLTTQRGYIRVTDESRFNNIASGWTQTLLMGGSAS